MNNEYNVQKILINEGVEFIPSRRELVDDCHSKKIKLQVPASLCLEKLLNNKGHIISQEELMLCGWGGKRIASVSSNAYYQSILHLRKSLAAMGLTEIIDTVPRLGLKINESVEVVFVCCDSIEDVNTGLEEIAAEEPAPSTCPPDNYSDSQDTRHVALETPVLAGRGKKARLLRIISGIFFAVLSFLLTFYFMVTNSQHAFTGYIKLRSDTCNLYATGNKFKTDEIESILSREKLDCFDSESVFFNSSPMKSRLNLIYCSIYNKESQNCRSITIMYSIKE